jgi:hypothetical protein
MVTRWESSQEKHQGNQLAERIQIDKPEGAPAWMGDKFWNPQVKRWTSNFLSEKQPLIYYFIYN